MRGSAGARTAAMAPAERSARRARSLPRHGSQHRRRVSARRTAPSLFHRRRLRTPPRRSLLRQARQRARTNEATNRPAAAARDDAPPLALGTPTLAPRTGDDALDRRLARAVPARADRRREAAKIYPPLAIDRALEGRAEIRLVFGGEGRLAAALVKRSSGHELLDRQALETLREASAVTPIPPALRKP